MCEYDGGWSRASYTANHLLSSEIMGIVVGVCDDIVKLPVEADSVVEPVGALVVQMFTRTPPKLMVRSDQDVGRNASKGSLGGYQQAVSIEVNDETGAYRISRCSRRTIPDGQGRK